MPSKSALMAGGMPGAQANRLGFDDPSAALTATGSVQGDALALAGDYLVFGTVAASTGAILPASSGQFIVVNAGANALKIYPPVGLAINGGTVNVAFSVTNGKTALFIMNGRSIAAILSA